MKLTPDNELESNEVKMCLGIMRVLRPLDEETRARAVEIAVEIIRQDAPFFRLDSRLRGNDGLKEEISR